VHQLDRTVAEVEHLRRGERVVGGVALSDPLRALRQLRRRRLVCGDRDRPVRLAEGLGAEGVVEVPVGVDDPDHVAGAEPARVGHDLAPRRTRAVGVDHQQAPVAADQADVDVEPRVSRHPDPRCHLGEVTHGLDPSSIGTQSVRVPEEVAAVQDERRLAVLRAIVEDYVATEEPVGSKALVERHRLGVSPATVRNDMAALEEEGFITQPHTSAGRVPTDKGYRLFVDRLTTLKPMSAAERKAIASFLDGAVDLDDVVNRSVRVLAQLTRQVAVVQYPTLSRSTVRHVELVALAPSRLLTVLILSTGRVEQRLVEMPVPLDDDDLAELRTRLNAAATGQTIADAVSSLRGLVTETPTASPVADALAEAMSDHRSDERIVVGGAANLARFGDSFDSAVRPLLEALEEHVVLLKLLGEATAGDTVTVRIGHEGPYQELASTSVVATGYGPGDEALATLGVVGPTRMDYPGSMAAVRAVARYVSRILDEA
jgi:heat-inducible transcriptional repressor